MASTPQLPNHLIRELTNIVRLYGHGDAMVLLALSGKEPLCVFNYVINTNVRLCLVDGNKIISNLEAFDQIKPPFKLVVAVSTEGAQRLFSRFVRNLDVLTIDGLRMPIDWASLTALKIDDVSNRFVADLVNGTISLTNLRKLTITLTLAQCLKLLSTTSCLSLPENVTFCIDGKGGKLTYVSSFQTFPKVKHLEFCCQYEAAITVELLFQFSTLIKGLPNLETAKLDLLYEHDFHPFSFSDIVTVKEQFCHVSFSVPVHIYFNEQVYNHSETPKYIFDRLKSIGFKRSYSDDPLIFDFDLEYDNVKLGYNLLFMPVSNYY